MFFILCHSILSLAGNHISDDIWYRVVQIVTNHEELHAYAAATVLEVLYGTLKRVVGYFEEGCMVL